MKWPGRKCVFNGRVSTPGAPWLWEEYIIGLENGNYMLSSEDSEEYEEGTDYGTDWSVEVAVENVVKTFIDGPSFTSESGWGTYYSYDYTGRPTKRIVYIQGILSSLDSLASAAEEVGDRVLFKAITTSEEYIEFKEELQERH
jgi:hypothetical protein